MVIQLTEVIFKVDLFWKAEDLGKYERFYVSFKYSGVDTKFIELEKSLKTLQREIKM